MVAAILPAAVVAHLVGRNLVEGWRRNAIEGNQTQAALAAFGVEAYVRQAEGAVTSHARDPLLFQALEARFPSTIAQALADLDRRGIGLATLLVLDADGVVRFQTPLPG